MFTPTVLGILMPDGRSVLSPAQRGAGSERVKFKVKFFDGLVLIRAETENSWKSILSVINAFTDNSAKQELVTIQTLKTIKISKVLSTVPFFEVLNKF